MQSLLKIKCYYYLLYLQGNNWIKFLISTIIVCVTLLCTINNYVLLIQLR